MELIKTIEAICGLFNIIKHKNQTIITSNICVTDPKCPFNKNISIARVRSMLCQVPIRGIERPFILFHFTVFLMDMVSYFCGNQFPWEKYF